MSFNNPFKKFINYLESKKVKEGEPEKIKISLSPLGDNFHITKLNEGQERGGINAEMTVVKIEDPKKTIPVSVKTPGIPSVGDIFYISNYGKCRIESIDNISFESHADIASMSKNELIKELNEIHETLTLLTTNQDMYREASNSFQTVEGVREVREEAESDNDKINKLQERFVVINMKLDTLSENKESE